MNNLKGYRILGFDYGAKRTGVAICDELHITTRPLNTFDTSEPNFMQNIQKIIDEYHIKHAVVGIPNINDGNKTKIILEIENFIEKLKSNFNLTVFTVDESYSSRRATDIMLEIGTKKSKRKQKGSVDKIASALILQDFIDNYCE